MIYPIERISKHKLNEKFNNNNSNLIVDIITN